ncbi:MAG: CRTAC1 family protein, partial [Bacteroidota bacterium]|nr:CRTAC1 family protein [Bacteroidota bacterium]
MKIALFIIPVFLFFGCKQPPKALPNQEMIDLLKVSEAYDFNPQNVFSPGAKVKSCDSILNVSTDQAVLRKALHDKANALLQLGEEQKAIPILEDLLKEISLGEIEQRQSVMKDLAIGYLRLGERTNCIRNHSAESCIYPISGGGIHQDKTGSEKAIELYKKILVDEPGDLESKWLLNIAYMTTGRYPQDVPPQFLLKVTNDDSLHLVKPFMDVAMGMGLNYKCIAGGSIIDD